MVRAGCYVIFILRLACDATHPLQNVLDDSIPSQLFNRLLIHAKLTSINFSIMFSEQRWTARNTPRRFCEKEGTARIAKRLPQFRVGDFRKECTGVQLRITY